MFFVLPMAKQMVNDGKINSITAFCMTAARTNTGLFVLTDLYGSTPIIYMEVHQFIYFLNYPSSDVKSIPTHICHRKTRLKSYLPKKENKTRFEETSSILKFSCRKHYFEKFLH